MVNLCCGGFDSYPTILIPNSFAIPAAPLPCLVLHGIRQLARLPVFEPVKAKGGDARRRATGNGFPSRGWRARQERGRGFRYRAQPFCRASADAVVQLPYFHALSCDRG